PGSLPQAIADANALAGMDTIAFAVPGTGVRTITLTADLPPITDAVTIDGYTQLGASANTRTVGSDAVILIEIDGGKHTGFRNGPSAAGASGTVVRGLSLVNFAGAAISFTNDPGGGATAERVKVAGNFIGLRADGKTAGPNDVGVVFASKDDRAGYE